MDVKLDVHILALNEIKSKETAVEKRRQKEAKLQEIQMELLGMQITNKHLARLVAFSGSAISGAMRALRAFFFLSGLGVGPAIIHTGQKTFCCGHTQCFNFLKENHQNTLIDNVVLNCYVSTAKSHQIHATFYKHKQISYFTYLAVFHTQSILIHESCWRSSILQYDVGRLGVH